MINRKGIGINLKKKVEERGQVLRQEEGINEHEKERKSTWQHVAMKMHAKERNVPRTQAHQAIWGEWQKFLPYA